MNQNHTVNSAIEFEQYDSPFFKIKCLQVSECNYLNLQISIINNFGT